MIKLVCIYFCLLNFNNWIILEDNEPIVDGNINTNKTCIFKLPDNSKDERKINYPSSAANIKSS